MHLTSNTFKIRPKANSIPYSLHCHATARYVTGEDAKVYKQSVELLHDHSPYPLAARPVESHSGAQEIIIAGPYHPPFCMFGDRDAEGVEREETWGLGVRRSVVSSPSGVMDFMHILFYAYFTSERSHLEHHFQYFWATAGPPNVAGLGKLPPFSPLDGPAGSCISISQPRWPEMVTVFSVLSAWHCMARSLSTHFYVFLLPLRLYVLHPSLYNTDCH